LLIGEDKEEVFCFKKQEGMDDWVKVNIEQVRTGARIEVKIERVRTEQAVLAQYAARNQQLEDSLDREIELIRKIMLKVSQRKTSARKRRSSSSEMKTETDCERAVSGAK